MFNLSGLINLFARKGKSIRRFAIYYGSEEKERAFEDFDLVVLESGNPRIVHALKKEHKVVLAYLSVGEINSSREYFASIREKGLLLENNPNWPEAFLVDIRNPEWGTYAVDTLIPKFLEEGFDGIFIDTLDSPIEKEKSNPVKFRGMKRSAISIIENARHRHPNMKIMLNRAYEIAPDVIPYIDYLLGESVCNTYDFSTGKYSPVDLKSYENQVRILDDLKKMKAGLEVMTLDYCDDRDEDRKREIYRKQKKNGFIPYVTTIDLCKISKTDSN